MPRIARISAAPPDGHRWCRGRRGLWHLLRADELAHRGAAPAAARSVCGLWASLLPAENAWTEVVERVTPAPRQLCAACLAAVAEAQRRERLQASPARQARLL
jgi:hypothetical protein